MYGLGFFFLKQKTAYEVRISDWSSDVCSSDLAPAHALAVPLYTEHSLLVSATDGIAISDRPEWRELPALPMCLLHQGMQNRRILDARLAGLGLAIGRALCRERVCQDV